MGVRSVPSILRTLAIFVASLHATGGGLGSVVEAHDLRHAPAQPVVRTDVAEPSSRTGADEIAGQTLLFATAELSSPSLPGSVVRPFDSSPVLAPGRRPMARDPRSAHSAQQEPLARQVRATQPTVVEWLDIVLTSSPANDPQRIRAP